MEQVTKIASRCITNYYSNDININVVNMFCFLMCRPNILQFDVCFRNSTSQIRVVQRLTCEKVLPDKHKHLDFFKFKINHKTLSSILYGTSHENWTCFFRRKILKFNFDASLRNKFRYEILYTCFFHSIKLHVGY